MRNHLMLSTASRIAFAKADEGSQAAKAPAADLGVTKVTIATLDVDLPNKFGTGHILSDVEAKVLDAAFRRQFANNQNAAFKAWEDKVKAYDALDAAGKAKAGERPANPCTDAHMLELYATYVPSVGAAGQTQAEKNKYNAGLRAVAELFEEHNALLAAKKPGFLGNAPIGFMKTNTKGGVTADAVQAHKDAWVAKILASEKQADRVQRHLDAIIAEQGAKKDTPDVQAVDVASIDI